MSVTWQCWIYCDGDHGCQFRHEACLVGEGVASPTEQRQKLSQLGWRRYRGKDYCGECFEGKFHLADQA